MNKALRGWRRKKSLTWEQFNARFDRFDAKQYKRNRMRRIRGARHGFTPLIHKGRKP